MTLPIKIRMLKTIRPDPIITRLIGEPENTVLEKGQIHEAKTSPHGTVSALATNGRWMGIVHGTEFEFMEAPIWLLKIHGVCL
jgi:hypothetical protein